MSRNGTVHWMLKSKIRNKYKEVKDKWAKKNQAEIETLRNIDIEGIKSDTKQQRRSPVPPQDA